MASYASASPSASTSVSSSPARLAASASAAESAKQQMCALRGAVQSVLDASGGDFAIFWAPSLSDAMLSFQFRCLSAGVLSDGAEERFVLCSMFCARSQSLTFPAQQGLPGSVWSARTPIYFADIACAARGGNAGSGGLNTPLFRAAEWEACDVRSTLCQPLGRGVLEIGTVRRSVKLSPVSENLVWRLVKEHADSRRALDAAADSAIAAAAAQAAGPSVAFEPTAAPMPPPLRLIRSAELGVQSRLA